MPTTTVNDPSFINSARFNTAESERDPQMREYWRKGYLALRGLFRPEEIAAWQAECERLLQSEHVNFYNVRTPFRLNSGSLPERVDPVVDISSIFSALVRDPRIIQVVENIFQDKALLFKDKVIFKAPGTEGYTLHQDQAWWQMSAADDMLSVSIQIDGATVANGCIELFPGYHDRLCTPAGMFTNYRSEEVAGVNATKGEKMETVAGDVLIFHSLTPHQSSTNTANVSRRSLYLTYSATRVGDLYEEHKQLYINRLSEDPQVKGKAFFK